jgi:kumamolisin
MSCCPCAIPLHHYHKAQTKVSSKLRTFSPLDLMKLYNFPPPNNEKKHIVVVSFGGGLYGDYDEETQEITNGDVTKFCARLNIPTPTVKLCLLDGAPNNPDDDATDENTLDLQMIAGVGIPNLTITLIIGPNANNTEFPKVFQKTYDLKPDAVGCSWGFPEKEASPRLLKQMDNLFAQFVAAGINVCCASGDNGSSDGISGACTDFPASSPHVIACGGTRLVCGNSDMTYDSKTTMETVWNDNPTQSATGGGISKIFPKPTYQSVINLGMGRLVPDIAMNADPKTGVNFIVNGQDRTYGGTSIVAPFMAAYLALIGYKGSVAKFYQAPRSCFHDILQGNNGKYTAQTGFDLCSGLGSFDGSLLKTFLIS